MLTLGWSDGNTFLPINSVLLSSENKQNRLAEAAPMDKRTVAYKHGIYITESDILYGEPYAYSGTYDNSNGCSDPYSYNGNEAYGGTFVNAQVYTVPDGAFFYLGDNRPNSRDSRQNGCAALSEIRGKVFASLRVQKTSD